MARKPSRAVAEARAPAEVEADDPLRRRWRELDWFATPPWASRAGAELVKSVDPGVMRVWEPAAGDGIMSACLRDYFFSVFDSDIEPQGAIAGLVGTKCDFLRDAPVTWGGMPADWIVTNPPFALAEEFVRHGLETARGVAILCRLAFLESADRWPLHRDHLTTLAPFCERVPMQLGPWNPKCSTATAYAWFIYTRRGSGSAGVRTQLIPPGTRARLTKPDDIQRFCAPTAGALV
jgi:hypothetical protein